MRFKEFLSEQKKKFGWVAKHLKSVRARQKTTKPVDKPEGFDGLAEVHTINEPDNEMVLYLTPKYKSYKELWVDVEGKEMILRGFTKTGEKGKLIGKKTVKKQFKALKDLYTEDLEELLKKTINYKLEDF